MESLFKDIRYGIRSLLRQPGFTAVAVITLALGIGANSAVFSVVNAVILRPLPFKTPDQLVVVWETSAELAKDRQSLGQKLGSFPDVSGNCATSVPGFLAWRDQTRVFEDVAAYNDFTRRLALTGEGEPEEVLGVEVSPNFFSLLGTQAALGRTFTTDNAEGSNGDVVVLSYGLWQRRFGADPNIVGKTTTMSGKSYAIVGIAPPSFRFPRREDVWIPLARATDEDLHDRKSRYLDVIARLKPGVSLQQAQAELQTLASRQAQDYPLSNKGWSVALVPLHRQLVGEVRSKLLTLFGASGFVVLIACANLAALLLARGATRRREMAIRAAMGASRLRLARQTLIESVLLAILGGGAGILLAIWGMEILRSISPPDIQQLSELKVDLRLLGFAFGSSVFTGLLFGIAPALEGSNPDLHETLKEGSQWSGTSGRSNRLRNALVVSEVALALVLLTGAGLMINTLAHLYKSDRGFDAQRLLTLRTSLPASKYPAHSSQRAAFFDQVIERIDSIPGVESAAAVYPLPFSGEQQGTGFAVEGTALNNVTTNYRAVTPGYFKTMRIPLLKGRDFAESDAMDADGSPRVVVINESLAHHVWPTENPIGKRVALGSYGGHPPAEIIGVVGDARYAGLDAPAGPELYAPYYQSPRYATMFLVVRGSSDSIQIASAIRREIWAVDKNQPVEDMRTMEELISKSVAPRRFYMSLLGVFGAIALALAAVGLYGVVNFSATQRTREVGIRIALGAKAGDVLGLFLKQGMFLNIIGSAIGLVVSFALTRTLASLLFEVSPTDPLTFVVVALFLGAVSFAACYIPARRATKVDPLVALRYE